MCATKYARTVVCTVGNLVAGQRYRDPEGETWMVVNDFADYDNAQTVANLKSGELKRVDSRLKLGHDRLGRLFAGRFLNPNKPDPIATEPAEVQPFLPHILDPLSEERISLAECLPAPEPLEEQDDGGCDLAG